MWNEVGPNGGLSTHVNDEVLDGVLNFTDILILMSREDYARVALEGDEWIDAAVAAIEERFDQHCSDEKLSRMFPDRGLKLRILSDGSDEIGGQILGIEAGEIVTGILPNYYTGPTAESWPVIAIHLNLPGVWSGYKEVGRLFNDQVLFTLGSHWLDNFSHESLRELSLIHISEPTRPY